MCKQLVKLGHGHNDYEKILALQEHNTHTINTIQYNC